MKEGSTLQPPNPHNDDYDADEKEQYWLEHLDRWQARFF